jgi:trans-2,3-dihydro-3-hydroxyanthranilate isomerase
MPLPYTEVDVFTDTLLLGNALAVVHEAAGLSSSAMAAFARWTNLSETTFLLPPTDPGADYAVRIFTVDQELPFAGHPTLGTALLLAGDRDAITLETGAGDIRITVDRATGEGQMAQPIPTWQPYDHADELLAAIGVDKAELPVEIYQNGPKHVYVALPEIENLAPDLTRLGKLGAMGVNCFTGSGDEWQTRVFCPGMGIAEDPATGSAAGPLAVHLARHGQIGYGRRVRISQGAQIGRPSTLFAQVDGAGDEIERVLVAGSAVVVARGEFGW